MDVSRERMVLQVGLIQAVEEAREFCVKDMGSEMCTRSVHLTNVSFLQRFTKRQLRKRSKTKRQDKKYIVPNSSQDNATKWWKWCNVRKMQFYQGATPRDNEGTLKA